LFFCPPGEDLEHPVDLLFPADDGVQLPALGKLGEVPAELIEGGCRALLRGRLGGCPAEVIDDQLAGAQEIDAETAENLPADAFLFADEPEEEMLAPDVVMPEEPRLFDGVFEDFLGAGREGNIAEGERISAGREVPFHLHADLVDVDAHLPEDGDGNSIFFPERPKENMLGAEIIVLKPLRFFAGINDYFSSSFRKLFEHHEKNPP